MRAGAKMMQVCWFCDRANHQICCVHCCLQPTSPQFSPQETALPFHSSLQSGGFAPGFFRGWSGCIAYTVIKGMNDDTSYDISPLKLGTNQFHCYIGIQIVHIEVDMNLHCLAKLAEPLGTWSGHKLRGSCTRSELATRSFFFLPPKKSEQRSKPCWHSIILVV